MLRQRTFFLPLFVTVLVTSLFIVSCATPGNRVAAVRPIDDAVPPVDEPVDEVDEADLPDEQELAGMVVTALRAGNADEARSLLEQIGPPPAVPELWLAYGHVRLADGDIAAADAVYRLVAGHPSAVQADALYVRALITDDSSEAEGLLLHAIEVEPDHVGAGAALGTIAFADGRTRDAERYFQTALNADPEHFGSLVGMARINIDRPPRRVALEYIDRALSVDPEAGFVHAERGRVLAILRRTNESVESYQTAIALEPQSPWHRYDLGRVLQEAGRHQEAVDRFNEAIGLNSDVFLFFFHRANSLYAVGRYQDALADYIHVLSVEPGYRDAFAPFAATSFLTGDFAQAARYFERTFDELHRLPSFALLTGIALRQDGRQTQANQWFEQVRRLAGTDSLYSQIAVEFVRPRNDDLTIRRIQSNRDAATRARMSFYLGALYAMLGRTALADALLENARVPEIEGSIEFELAGWFLDTYGQGHAR